MSQLSIENRRRILRNPHVKCVTEKHIVFNEEFQRKALKLRAAGVSTGEILTSSGFRASDFTPRYFDGCIKRWRIQEKSNLSKKSKKENRGRPKGSGVKNYETLENLSADDLKSIILVQEEMIKELKKRKALAKNK